MTYHRRTNLPLVLEYSISANQDVTAQAYSKAFVCTAALTLTLPLTTTVAKSFFFAVYAQGGDVTITPDAADRVDGGAMGDPYLIAVGTSVMMFTDSAGNWWPFFLKAGTTTGTALPNGSVSAPSLFFSASPASGLYRIGADDWGAASAGVSVWEANAAADFIVTNRLGVGMTPVNVVDITKTQNSASTLALKNANAGTAAYAGLSLVGDTHTATLKNFSTGFTTAGDAVRDSALLSNNGAGGIGISTHHASGKIKWYTDSTLRATLDEAGLLGLGVAAPSFILDIEQDQDAGSIAQILNSDSGTAAYAEFRAKNSNGLAFGMGINGGGFTTSGMSRQDGAYLAANCSGGLSIFTSVAQPIYFGINLVEKMRLDTSGNLLLPGVATFGGFNWIAAGGTVNVITATYSPAFAALVDGMECSFRASGANTSTTPTFSPNGLTAHTIVKSGGQALLAGDIPRANYECCLRYNSANTRWELLNPAKPTVACNVQNSSYAASGMPSNITLSSVSGAPSFIVTAFFSGTFTNNNGTALTAKLTVAIKDGSTTLQSKQLTQPIVTGTGTTTQIMFSWTFSVIAPASDYTVVITDTEDDGGSHTFTISNLIAAAVA